MFKAVDSTEEAVILAAERKSRKGPDFSIRTAAHWFTLTHKFAFCSVPSHYDNVPDEDYTGAKYDKYPNRLCVQIGPYHVCRWCFLAEADVIAADDNLPPTVRNEDTDAPGN